MRFQSGCKKVDKFVLFIGTRSILQQFFPFSPGGTKSATQFSQFKDKDTLTYWIWGYLRMNTEQIEVFKELKEHFWREDVLYQTIKTKERLCHSCKSLNIEKYKDARHISTFCTSPTLPMHFRLTNAIALSGKGVQSYVVGMHASHGWRWWTARPSPFNEGFGSSQCNLALHEAEIFHAFMEGLGWIEWRSEL